MSATSDASAGEQVASLTSRRARWPTVIGILSFCYGLVAFIARLLLLVVIVLAAAVPPITPETPQIEPQSTYSVIMHCLGMGASAGLLIGGILLILRRPSARLVHLLWAAVATLLMCEIAVRATIGLVTADPTDSTGTRGADLLLALTWFVIRLPYPAFVLVWFLRLKIQEQVKAWKHAPPAPVAYTPVPVTTVPSAPTPAVSMPKSLVFRQDARYNVQVSDTGLIAKMDKESIEIPWEAVMRLDFDQEAFFGDATAGVVRLTDVGGRTLAWTDSALFCTPSGPYNHPQVLQDARNRGSLRPAGKDGGNTLFLPGSLAMTAAVIEKAGLVEQPDGAFARAMPSESAAPCPTIEHPSPEEHVPKTDMRSRRLKQVVLLVAGFLAFSYMSSAVVAAGMVAFLLFHEYGHAVAMKWCGVRVDGIFILPFMGAVVVSKDEASTQWKEFLIAIMGSVFGAAMTLAAVVATLATHGAYPVLIDTAEWFAMVSLFNLLPLGILDGGRIMTSIAYSTHRVVGTIASVLAIVLCVAAALALQSWLLGIVAVFTILEMRAASRAYRQSAALLGIGCTAAGLRRGAAATWQRLGVIAAEGNATLTQKARQAVRALESFRRFFSGQFEIPGMTRSQIAAAVAIYAATVGFFLILLVGTIIVQVAAKQA